MKTRLLACVSVAVLFVVTPIPMQVAAQNQSAEEQQKKAHLRYRVRDLGTLGGTFTQPGGINDKGEIEGFGFLSGDTEQHAFYWQKGHLTVIPGLGGPNSIAGWAPSETGQVGGAGDTSNPDPLGEDFCGFGTFFSCHPFVWRRGTITPLPLPSGNNAVANGFNNRNQVVGKAESSDPDPTCPPPGTADARGYLEVWSDRKGTPKLSRRYAGLRTLDQ